MKLWQRFFGTDAQKADLDKRLFLLGATITASGLILPRSIISVPAPLPKIYEGGTLTISVRGVPFPIEFSDWTPEFALAT